MLLLKNNKSITFWVNIYCVLCIIDYRFVLIYIDFLSIVTLQGFKVVYLINLALFLIQNLPLLIMKVFKQKTILSSLVCNVSTSSHQLF